jgi:SAM-dependent methyltransferase
VLRRARELFDPLHGRPALDRPLPPRRLRARAGAPGAREFLDGGRLAAEALAAPLGDSLSGLRSVLDFGCGAGRVLPHVSALIPGAACVGCDVDPTAIAWNSRHLPRWSWRLCGPEPPLPFETGAFDLVYSISVFSHLDEPLQDRWLADVARVLRPGAVALLSVHGPHAFEQFRSGRARTSWCDSRAFDRGALAAGEFVFVPYRRSIWNAGELPGIRDGYGLAFHGIDYPARRWPPRLEVQRVLPRAMTGWQDLVVCRRSG